MIIQTIWTESEAFNIIYSLNFINVSFILHIMTFSTLHTLIQLCNLYCEYEVGGGMLKKSVS